LTLKGAQIEGTSDQRSHKPLLSSELESIIKSRLRKKVIFIHGFSVITFMGNAFVISKYFLSSAKMIFKLFKL